MERRGAHKPDDFSVLASDSFRMDRVQVDPANARVTRILADALPIKPLAKAVTPTKPGAVEEKLSF